MRLFENTVLRCLVAYCVGLGVYWWIAVWMFPEFDMPAFFIYPVSSVTWRWWALWCVCVFVRGLLWAFTMLCTIGVYHLFARQDVLGGPYCRRCGYVLRGLDEPRCPECGTRI